MQKNAKIKKRLRDTKQAIVSGNFEVYDEIGVFCKNIFYILFNILRLGIKNKMIRMGYLVNCHFMQAKKGHFVQHLCAIFHTSTFDHCIKNNHKS